MTKGKGAFFLDLSDKYDEGEWRWADGTEMEWSNWGKGEPDGGKTKNYVIMSMYPDDSGAWYDQDHETNSDKYDDNFQVVCQKSGDSSC